jgi:hypothetical protein
MISFQSKGQHFYRIYTDQGFDYGEGITQASDSTYFITGSSSSFEDAPSQAYILHLDTAGNYLWSKAYGGSESDIGKRIFSIKNDGIYVFGHSNSFTNGYFDFYLFKTDFQGKIQWEKNIGGFSHEMLHDAVMLPDTSFILVGQTTSNKNEIEDVITIRVDKHGEVKWEKRFGGDGVDIGKSIALIDTNQIIIGGSYSYVDSSLTKGLIISINQDGKLNWQQHYGLIGNYVFNDLSVDSSIIRAVGYNQLRNNTQQRYLTFKCLPDGTSPIESVIHQSGSNYFSNIVQHGPYKNQYLVLQPTDNDVIPTYSGGEDQLICRYKYDLTWATKCVNTSDHGIDHCNDIIATNDLGAIAVGYNTYKGKGGANVTLVKIGPYDQFPVSLSDPIESSLVKIKLMNQENLISISPNPTNESIIINGLKNKDYILSILSLEGKILYRRSVKNEENINLKELFFETGSYFLQFENSENGLFMKKINFHP